MWMVVYIAVALSCGPLAGSVNAQSGPVLIEGPVSSSRLSEHLDYFIDDGWNLTTEKAISQEGPTFQKVRSKNPDFGYTLDRIWLRVKVKNVTQSQREWIIYFPENFKQYFRVDIAYQDGRIVNALFLDQDSPFDVRPIPNPEMLAPMTLEPGETATVFVSMWSEGSSYISFSIETPDSFFMMSADRTAKNFIFYGMMLLLIAAALVSLVLLRNGIFFAYSAYAASALLYVMHVDGVAFQYLWPDIPTFNSRASIFAGSGVIIFGAVFARSFLKTKQLHPIMDKVLMTVMVTTLVLDGSLYFTNPQLLKKILIFLSLLAIISFALSGLVAAWSRYREVRFYLLAWVGAVFSAVLLNLNHLFGFDLEQGFIYDSMRAVMVFDAAMMGLAIVDRYSLLRQSQRLALEERLGSTKRNLELSERLTNLTKNYDAMTDVAKARDEQIQNTVHDLRQPLHSLRLKVSDLIHNTSDSATDVSQVHSTFSYLEELISDYLVQPGDPHHPVAVVSPETLDLCSVLSSITEMFAQDAANKGIELTLNYQPVQTMVDPLSIMRIVSNLVSNAVNYTQQGRVIIAAYPSDAGAVISVSDTGPGLSEAEFALALNRDVRLAEKNGGVDGHGLGLSIANDLARKNGIHLGLGRSSGFGTSILVTLPTLTLEDD
jgi:signal transduction histidine kinase